MAHLDIRGKVFKGSHRGDRSYFEGERNDGDELLFEHSLSKSWKPGTHKYSKIIKAPSGKEINYIEVVDNWKNGTNGERDVTMKTKTVVRVTITGVFGRGVNWDIRVYARPTPNPTPDPPKHTPHSPEPTPDPQEPYAPLYFDLGQFKDYQGCRPPLADDWADVPRENPPVLCVVTTADLEYEAVVARLEPAIGHDVVLQVMCRSVPMLIGKLGNYQVALLQTHMGADDTKKALLQVLPSLSSVRLVLAIGFGYGLHPALERTPKDGQMIGDVMVSATCFDLSTYRATEYTIYPRGSVTSVTSVLANTLSKPLFEGWTRKLSTGGRPRPPTVHVGTYLSLPVLFDSEEHARPFVQAAAHYKPIGGDMELFQIISAIGEPGHPATAWLAIKSICDFGGLIKKSKDGQPLAAATAVDFACYFLSIPGLLDGLLEPTQDKNDMFQEISGYIDEMEQLIEDYENVLQPLPQYYEIKHADFDVENAYSQARRTITWFKGVDVAKHKQHVSADRLQTIRKHRDAITAFCFEVSQRPHKAAALICVEDLPTAAKRICPLLKPLGNICVSTYYRPNEEVFATVRNAQPFACLLVGCYENDTDLTDMKRLRLWNSAGNAHEMQPQHVADFIQSVRPVCTLLVADASDDDFSAKLTNSLEDGMYLIAWKGKVTQPLYEKFIGSFLRLCLSDATEGVLGCVECAYVQSVLELTHEPGATRPVIMHPCSQTVTELLSQHRPKKIRIEVSGPKNLLNTGEEPSLLRIKNLLCRAVVKARNFEHEARTVIKGFAFERDIEELNSELKDLEFLGFDKVKVDRFPRNGSLIFTCVVSDLSWFCEWGRKFAADLGSKTPPTFCITEIAITGLLVERSALEMLQKDRDVVEPLCTSDFEEERLFAGLVKSNLTFEEIDRVALCVRGWYYEKHDLIATEGGRSINLGRNPQTRAYDILSSGEVSRVTDADVKYFLSNKVTSVNLVDCLSITDSALQAIAAYCGANLTSLDVSGCGKLTDNALEAIGANCSNLTSLDVSGCRNLTDNALEAIGANRLEPARVSETMLKFGEERKQEPNTRLELTTVDARKIYELGEHPSIMPLKCDPENSKFFLSPGRGLQRCGQRDILEAHQKMLVICVLTWIEELGCELDAFSMRCIWRNADELQIDPRGVNVKSNEASRMWSRVRECLKGETVDELKQRVRSEPPEQWMGHQYSDTSLRSNLDLNAPRDEVRGKTNCLLLAEFLLIVALLGLSCCRLSWLFIHNAPANEWNLGLVFLFAALCCSALCIFLYNGDFAKIHPDDACAKMCWHMTKFTQDMNQLSQMPEDAGGISKKLLSGAWWFLLTCGYMVIEILNVVGESKWREVEHVPVVMYMIASFYEFWHTKDIIRVVIFMVLLLNSLFEWFTLEVDIDCTPHHWLLVIPLATFFLWMFLTICIVDTMRFNLNHSFTVWPLKAHRRWLRFLDLVNTVRAVRTLVNFDPENQGNNDRNKRRERIFKLTALFLAQIVLVFWYFLILVWMLSSSQGLPLAANPLQLLVINIMLSTNIICAATYYDGGDNEASFHYYVINCVHFVNQYVQPLSCIFWLVLGSVTWMIMAKLMGILGILYTPVSNSSPEGTNASAYDSTVGADTTLIVKCIGPGYTSRQWLLEFIYAAGLVAVVSAYYYNLKMQNKLAAPAHDD